MNYSHHFSFLRVHRAFQTSSHSQILFTILTHLALEEPSMTTKKRLVKTTPGLQNYPLLDNIHSIVPMPLITYADAEVRCEFKPNACRLTRDVTREAPTFETYPLCFTLQDNPDSLDTFIKAMRSTVNWLAHKKGTTGRPATASGHSTSALQPRRGGPTKVHDYTWTYHCPSFRSRRTTPGSKLNPLIVMSQAPSPPKTTQQPPHLLPHLVDDPEHKRTRKRKPSYKCGSPAKFTVRRRADNGCHEVEWFWRHTGHDPFNIDNMRHQRMSAPLQAWLDERVLSGLTWKTVSKLLQTPDLFPVSR